MSESRLRLAGKKVRTHFRETLRLMSEGFWYAVAFSVFLLLSIPFLIIDLAVFVLLGRDLGWFPAEYPDAGHEPPDTESSQETLRRITADQDANAQRALRLVTVTEPPDRPGLSKIGGAPDAPPGFEWPSWSSAPLAFVAQIALAELPPNDLGEHLPETGLFYFFYLQNQSTWGFDPADLGSWRVLYSPVIDDLTRLSFPAGVSPHCRFGEKRVEFHPLRSYPTAERLGLGPGELTDEDSETVEQRRTGAFEGAPQHQIGGFPSPVQGDDMELECQLVSNGLYCGDSSGYTDPKAAELEAGANEWRLLLQLDTDDDAGMMWGDCGMLYFWIRQQDLANRDFKKVWMILQCC